MLTRIQSPTSHQSLNMAFACGVGEEEFIFEDDLDDLLTNLDQDLQIESEAFDADLNVLMDEIESTPPVEGFPCETCDKICKTKRGLTRHRNAAHVCVQPNAEGFAKSNTKTPEQKLHPLSFKKFIETSVAKLASDECYSDKLRAEFTQCQVSFADATFSYKHVRNVIGDFKGSAEKFYPDFTDVCRRRKQFLRIFVTSSWCYCQRR